MHMKDRQWAGGQPAGTCEGEVAQELDLLAHDLGLGDVVDVDHLGSQPARQRPVGPVVRQQDAHVQRGEEQPLAVGRLVEVVLVGLQKGRLILRARSCTPPDTLTYSRRLMTRPPPLEERNHLVHHWDS